VSAAGEVWAALTGSATLPAPLEILGPREPLPSVFPVTTFATGAVGASLVAASVLAAARNGIAPAPVGVDTRHVATALRSERNLWVNGKSGGVGFAPLSRFWRAADGWIRTHANYPWHRDRLLAVLGVPDDLDAVGNAIAEWPTVALEDAVFAAGGCAAAARTVDEWCAQPQGRVLDVLPLLHMTNIGVAPPRLHRPAPPAARGLHVLDLTRAIAGPVCTRTLAAHGADVLRVDTPALPENAEQALDGLCGKRSAFVDLRSPVGDAEVEALLANADVVVMGYRPGALHQFGLSPDALAARHPGVVVLTLCAWGHEGPWSSRRGFDSLVQSACGIAMEESRDGVAPGVLPAQALDHITGYLAAAAILVALRRQLTEGGTWHVQCSLAQTATWLLRQPRIAPSTADAPDPALDPAPYLVELTRGSDTFTAVAPPGAIDARPLAWPSAPPVLGSSAARWLDVPAQPTWLSSG
jgi:crotonobetainyl-CoA:carnitine CoA-transferase CaiB-like acyl-CoA transferase